MAWGRCDGRMDAKPSTEPDEDLTVLQCQWAYL